MSSALVCPDPELRTIRILCGWWRIWFQFGLCSFVFCPVISSKLSTMFNSLLSDVLFLFVFCIHYIAKWMLALYQALVFFLSASTSSAVLRIFPVNTSCPSLLTFAAMLNFYFQTCLCSLENLFLFWLHILLSFFLGQYEPFILFAIVRFICTLQRFAKLNLFGFSI